MEQFVGTWKLVSSDNFDEYMKEVGKCRYVWPIMCKLDIKSHLKGLETGTSKPEMKKKNKLN